MGMDGIELILAVEETFGIQISDEDAGAVSTLGDFADCVMRLVGTDKTAPCFSQKRFYRIRSARINAFGIPRKRIRPHTPLRDFIRKGNTRKDWQAFRLALEAEGIGLPALHQPQWFSCSVRWGLSLVWMITVIPLIMRVHPLVSIAIYLALIVPAIVLLEAIGGWRIPARFQTVASLIPSTGNVTQGEQTTVWTRDAVLATLFKLTSEQLGVPIEEIKEYSRFHEDLRMDN
jgi:acyl carrier protein